MTTALAAPPMVPVATAMVTPDQVELIKRTVAKDATADELKLYFYDCARQGVHPLDRLIHFTKRGGRYTPVTSIDFMRIQAHSTGECLGISDPEFDAGTVGGPPLSATVTVKRLVQGQVAVFTATARWMEYCPAQGQDHMWRKMPHTMLGKCAEALALRKGFPKQLAGLYAREEMDQAGQEEKPLVEAPRVPEKVNLGTGEVVEAQRQPLPDGALYIESCTPGTGKKAGTVKLSNGEAATVWASDGRLFDLAVVLCQEGKPVKATLQPGKGNYGPTLKALTRLDVEQTDKPWVDDVPPIAIDASEIPF